MNSMLLEKSILETVAFFDIFDYPLTSFEIWQYAPVSATLLDVRNTLEQNVLKLESRNGFFFLPGREHILHSRSRRYNIADQKIKKARRRLRLLQWLPGIRLVCLANSIGSHNFRPGGDTDLFIITKNGRLWLVKCLATIITAMLGWRPTATKSADQLCLSFLIDESALDLSHFSQADVYFPYWLAGLTPLYGDPKVYNRLIKENAWLEQRLPNWRSACAMPRNRFTLSKRSVSSFFGTWPEKIAKKTQEYFMSPTIKTLANKDQRVVVTDHILKLHTVDRREYFKQQLHNRLQPYV